MDYEKLLEKGLKDLPERAKVSERYEIPKVKGHIEGNKTIINNFNQIVNSLHREAQHFLKFLLNELATPGKLDDSRLILGRKLSPALINNKIEQYANIYVFCYDCGKPDTKLDEQEGILYIRCTACGAKHKVKIK